MLLNRQLRRASKWEPGAVSTIVLCGGMLACTVASGAVDGLGIHCGGSATSRQDLDSPPYPYDSDWIVGWTAGGYVEWLLPLKSLTLLTEAWWMEKGYDVRFESTGTEASSKDAYLSLPVLVAYRVRGAGPRIFAFAGPSIEYSLKGSSEDGESGPLGIAVNVGGGINVTGHLETRIRANWDLSGSRGQGPNGNETVKNQCVTVTIGLRADMSR